MSPRSTAAGACAVEPRIFIGTSGWVYPQWRESFYLGVPRRCWLTHYAGRFQAVEINASYYRLQRVKTYEGWRDATPPDFRFALKANRYLPAYRRLAAPAESIGLERARALGLGEKLAVVLWQCPSTLRCDLGRLQAFLDALERWPEVRHALEFRHRSWFDDRVQRCLGEHDVAICQSDAADWPRWDAVSTDLVYVRLHGHTRTYLSRYRAATLGQWAQRIRSWAAEGRNVHVYFDNTAAGAAVGDAERLRVLASALSP